MTKATKTKVEVTQYFLSLHMGAVLGPVRKWKKLTLADKIAWEGEVTDNAVIEVAKGDLFGGIQQQGGFIGDVHFLNGGPAQELPELLAGKLGRTVANCPGFRGFTSFFFVERAVDPGPGGAMWATNSNTMPKISVTLEDLPDSWYPARAGLAQVIAEPGEEGGEPLIPQGAYSFGGGVSDNEMSLDFQNRRAYAFQSQTSPAKDIMRVYDLGDPAHPVIETHELNWDADVDGAIGNSRLNAADGLIYMQVPLASGSTLGSGNKTIAFNPLTRQIVSTNSADGFHPHGFQMSEVGNKSLFVGGAFSGLNDFKFNIWSFDGVTFADFGQIVYDDDPGPAIAGQKTASTTTFYCYQGGDLHSFTVDDVGTITDNGLLHSFGAASVLRFCYDSSDDNLIVQFGSAISKYKSSDGSFDVIWTNTDVVNGRLLSDSQDRHINRVAVHFHSLNNMTLIDSNTGLTVFSESIGTSSITARHIYDDQTGSLYYVNAGTDRLVAEQQVTTGDCFDANPVHIIHEVLTDTEYGLGVPLAKLDDTAFTSAADTVFAEGIGISLLWSQQLTGEEFIDEILSHIEGVIFFDPHTGLIVLKLIRGDYDPATLRTITVDNAELGSFRRKSLGETVNQLTVSYTNSDNEEEASVTIQDLGNIAQQGEVVADTVTYAGVRTARLALQLATRDLRVLSYPLATAEVTLDHSFWDIVPGEPVKLTWTFPNGDTITDMVMRVGEVTKGHKGRDEISVKLTEDIFALPVAEFASPPRTLDTVDRENPRNIDYVAIFTLPYYLMVNEVDPDALSGIDDPSGATSTESFAGIVAAQEGVDTRTYEVLAEETIDALGTLGFVSQGNNTIVPRAILDTALAGEVETVLPVQTATQGLPPAVGAFVLIGDGTEALGEFAIITAVVTGVSYTLKRGMLDTTPKTWPIGTQLWFIDPAADIVDDVAYAAPDNVDYKLLTVTSRDTLDVTSAVTSAGTIDERPYKPLRPANVQADGVGFGTANLTGATANVTWSNRNRLMEDSIVQFWDAGDITGETGQTTIIQALDLAKTFIAEVTGLVADGGSPVTAHAFPLTNFGVAEEGYIRVLSERDGFRSLQGHDIFVTIDANFLASSGDQAGNGAADLLIPSGDQQNGTEKIKPSGDQQ